MTSEKISGSTINDPSSVQFIVRSMGASIYDDIIKQLDKAPAGGIVATKTPAGVDIRRHQARVSSAMNPRLVKLGKDYRVRVRTTVDGVVALVKVVSTSGDSVTKSPKAKKPKAPSWSRRDSKKAESRKKAKK